MLALCEKETSSHFRGFIPYAEGVTAGSLGLAMRSELPWVEVPLLLYAESVIARGLRSAITPYRVACLF